MAAPPSRAVPLRGYALRMGKVYEGIDAKLGAWIERQHLFFVATAPLAADGHVNVSPKGDLRWFRVLGPREVAYLDFVGSGAETIAHARENGRVVVMFCAFEGPPRIVRLHGRASVVLPGEPEFDTLRAQFEPASDALRSVIRIDVERIADSCGYGVPLLDYVADRDVLDLHQSKKPAEYYEDEYAVERNGASIDGLPGLSAASDSATRG